MWLLALLLLADTSRAFSIALAPAESVRVTVGGAGDPVVLIPGLFGSAFGYRSVLPRLVDAGYRTIVIEPLGIGASARPEHADYSLTAQADRVAAALDLLGVSDAIVIAHSVGAAIAYRLAYRRATTTRGFRRAIQLAPWIKLFGGTRLVRAKVRRGLIAASGDTTWVTDQVVDGYTAGAARDLDGTLKAYLAMAQARERERLAPHLGEIRCPVRLVVGTAGRGSGVSPEEVATLAGLLNSFAVDTVPGAGHFLYEEQPAAVVAAVNRVHSGDAARLAGPAAP
ncbi:MAG: hypothetical protein AUH12_02430 [Gemmatimonadetes bacterium 13_2_20CM_69_8]|nr:MAG: hypothetical protein AUH12_02430 [Gemmatimonadetes bacterium 13_2_20CM_69_8]